MITKLRLFVKEYMDAILTALGVFFLGTAFYVFATKSSPAAFLTMLGLGAIAFAGAMWFALTKERKRDKEHEEREKREIERDKRDQARFDKESAKHY